MSYNLLLDWASECGRGTWASFRESHDWLFSAGAESARPPKATTTAHGLSMLGHVEIDWRSGVWAVAPPALTILPNAGAHAILTGARTRNTLRRLAEESSEDVADLFWQRHEQEWGPEAIFVAAENDTEIEALAQRLHISYELCVSERIADMLPPIASSLALARSTPAARGYGIERWDARLMIFGRAESDREPGFYRYDLWGRPQYRFVAADGSYYAVDRAIGAYAELQRIGKTELRYEPDEVNGTLTVPFRAQLPALHARCAVLCSGLMPELDKDHWRWRYVNVPLATAQRIAETLGQEPSWAPSGGGATGA